MLVIQIIGFSASILGAITFLPEVIKALKTRHLGDVAWGMLLLLIINSLLWIAYGAYLWILPVLLSAIVNCSMSLILIMVKWQSEGKTYRAQKQKIL